MTARVEIGFSQRPWAEICSALPSELSEKQSAKFRSLVAECCNKFFETAKVMQGAAITAHAVKKGGGKQTAPFDQLERHLRSAANILRTMENMLDDRPGLLRRYQAQVSAIADDIVARKEALRKLQPVVINPKHELVRSLARVCESCGLKVGATNRIYDENSNRPTWFQEFVAALNDALLGAQGWGAAGNDKKALYADVLKALRGRKAGGSPKTRHRS